jgi:signal transduction histidine kinase/ligand-binding sensor domain-containing protein/DNA-binding response OmpR family regulator
MIKYLKRFIQLAPALLLFVTNIVHPQFAKEDFEFHTVEKNLFQRPVTTMVKDHDGFIWIGTDGAGLYRFNGLSYNYFGHELNNENSISSNTINSLLVDAKGNLWVGTNAGMSKYDKLKNKFSRITNKTYENTDNYFINVLCFAEFEGNIFVGTYDGIKKIDLSDLSLKNYAIPANAVLDLKFSTKGNLYIATNKGLKTEQYFNKGTIKDIPLTKSKSILNITKLHIDHKENLWIGTVKNGVFTIDLKRPRKTAKKLNLANNKVMAITGNENTTFIAIENEGLTILSDDGSLIKKIKYDAKNKHGIGSDSVWSLLYDNENRLWLGYYEDGLGFLDQYYNKFGSMKMEDNKNTVQTNDIKAFATTSSGNLYIAQTNAIDYLNTASGQVTPIYGQKNTTYTGFPKGNFIEDIFVDSMDGLWIATWGSGIYWLKKGSNTFLNFTKKTTGGNLRTDKIQSFSEDSYGRVWIGTFLEGVCYYDPLKKTIESPTGEQYQSSELNIKDIKVIHHDSNGFLWIGTSSGLYHINVTQKTEFDVVSHNNAISSTFGGHPSSNQILDIYETQDGTVWCGTNGGGLFSYNRETTSFERFKLEGQDITYVNAIYEPIKNELWLSSKLGVLKIERALNKVTNFTVQDGLLKNFLADGAIVLSGENTLYLGTKNGLNMINPKKIPSNPYLPTPYLKGLRIFNKKVNSQDQNSPLQISDSKNILKLKHHQTALTIDYGSISYTRPNNNQYAHYLENFDDTYNYVGTSTMATYTNLEPGDYTFYLKVANNDGLWTPSTTILNIEVLPPWWQTKWAYLLFFILFGALTATIMLSYRKKIEIKNSRKLERERRKQKVELQQQKLQFFTNISHEFRTPLTLIVNPIKELMNMNQTEFTKNVREKHQIIYKNADRLSRLINELMDFRKLQSDKLQLMLSHFKLVEQTKKILSFFNEEAKRRAIRLDLKYDDINLEAFADKGLLDKIFFNLLSNAFKVTPNNGRIQVEIRSGSQKILPNIDTQKKVPVIEISVKDNGPGIDQKEYKKIFNRFYQVGEKNKTYYGSTGIGLEMVKSFVELHKGIVEVDSIIGKGSIFTVIIPYGKKFFEKEFDKTDTALNTSNTNNASKTTISKKKYDVNEILSFKERKKTLLIVEDNLDLQDYISSIFKNKYKLILASDGQDGWLKSIEHEPDLIITDVIMPIMDGIEFCKKIKNNEKLRLTPIIMLSAKVLTKDRVKGIEIGVDAYVTKPFDKEELEAIVEQQIRKNDLSRLQKIATTPQKVQKDFGDFDNDFIQKVVDFIQNNIDNPELNVEMLSSHLCLSRSQVYRKVKKLTGLSPITFIRRIRLERSRTLLQNDTNLNVSEVAHSVGFLSASYFTLCYKKQFGELPKRD